MSNKLYLNVVVLVLFLGICASCRTVPCVDRTGGIGQLKSGITLVDAGAASADSAAGDIAGAHADVVATEAREDDRAAITAEQTRILSDSSLTITERIQKCQELIDASRIELSRYISESGQSK